MSKILDIGKPQIVIRSQVTPEIKFSLVPPEKQPPKKKTLVEKFSDWALKNIIKPEVEVQVSVFQHKYSPYGEPDKSVFPAIAAGLFVGMGVSLALLYFSSKLNLNFNDLENMEDYYPDMEY